MKINATAMAYVIDPLERAARTFVQQFIVVLMTAGSAGLLVHPNWLIGLDSAAFAALVSLLTSVLTFKVPVLPVMADLALRVVKTFLQSFVGTITATQVLNVSHVDWVDAIAVAIPVALTALLTGLAALGVPGTSGASLLPAGVTTAVESDGADGEIDYDAEAAKMAVSAPTALDSLNVSDPPSGPKHAA